MLTFFRLVFDIMLQDKRHTPRGIQGTYQDQFTLQAICVKGMVAPISYTMTSLTLGQLYANVQGIVVSDI